MDVTRSDQYRENVGPFLLVINLRITLNDDNLLANLGTNIFFKKKLILK